MVRVVIIFGVFKILSFVGIFFVYLIVYLFGFCFVEVFFVVVVWWFGMEWIKGGRREFSICVVGIEYISIFRIAGDVFSIDVY